MLRSRLYLRIWLAVVGAVVLLSLVMGWVWRLTHEDRAAPLREVVLREAGGRELGRVQSQAPLRPGQSQTLPLRLADGQQLEVELSRPLPPPTATPHGAGPHAPGPWAASPWGMPSYLWLVGLVTLAVAVGAYPIIRRLTQRLESLQRGVERWGEGRLSERVPVEGSDEVAFLAARFHEAAERIERLLASHKALLANASHELRSPLARIRMGLELMDGGSSAQREEMRRSIAELDALIGEILLASRLDASATDIAEPTEAVDLAGLAAEECARTGAELELSDAVAARGGLELSGSPRLLRRLMRNLLENAQRHGAGDVVLHLNLSGEGAELRVSDRGPGVPPAERERIFEPFHRLPGASEREGGVGLGLALVRSIAQRHGGRVHCEDRPGGGASFVVWLPWG